MHFFFFWGEGDLFKMLAESLFTLKKKVQIILYTAKHSNKSDLSLAQKRSLNTNTMLQLAL